MRARIGLLLLLAGGVAAVPRLNAQDVVDSTVVDDPDQPQENDGDEEPRPSARGNPYLREVDDYAPRMRRGPYWASFGVGAGGESFAGLESPAPYASARVRPTLTVAAGATLGQQLRLGLEGFAWFNLTGDGALETVTTLMLGGRVYPIASSGLYLRAAGGFGRYGQDLMDDDCGCSDPLVEDLGLAWAIGGGYEIPVGRAGLWIGPSIEVVRLNVTGPDGYRERVVNFGLTFTYDGK